MAYGKFNSYEEAATTFHIKLIELPLVRESPLQISSEMFAFIEDNLKTRRSYISENAICENLIAPILTVVAKCHNLPVWSHLRLDVSEVEGLIGIPDFIIAPASNIGTTFKNPLICVSEAKQENFNEGWGQCVAEMVAAQKFNNNQELEIFGIVTTGNIWQFGKLVQTQLVMDIIAYSAVENLQRLLNILNWMFEMAKENLVKYSDKPGNDAK
jgi:hypothetical protein